MASSGEHELQELPRAFGPYMLLARLGTGGMGAVFLAKHGGIAGIEKHCVVKTVLPQLVDDDDYVARFMDEARTLVQLSHKNICSVFDVGRADDSYFMAMEYIAGCDLETLCRTLRAGGRNLDPGLALHLVGEVLDALDYAHRRTHATTGVPLELVHRDVTPPNIMISFEGEVKLIDFGLAASTLKRSRTQVNVVHGKMAYMAPEHARGDRITGAADQFAVAVVLYELVVGERYYEGHDARYVWEIAGSGMHRPAKLDDVDPALRAVLERALHVDPAQRYPDCQAFRDALDNVRLERQWRGNAAGLRAVVIAELPNAHAKSRELRARFATVPVPMVVASDQDTVIKSFASSLDSSAEQTAFDIADRTEVDATGVTSGSDTVVANRPISLNSDSVETPSPVAEPPPPPPPAPARSRLPLFGALAGLVVGAVAAAVFAGVSQQRPTPVAAVADAGVVSAAPPATTTAPPATAPDETVPEEDVIFEAAEDELEESEPSSSSSSGARKKRVKAKGRAADPATMTRAQLVAHARAKCAQLACARTLIKNDAEYVTRMNRGRSDDVAWLRADAAAVAECRAKCR